MPFLHRPRHVASPPDGSIKTNSGLRRPGVLTLFSIFQMFKGVQGVFPNPLPNSHNFLNSPILSKCLKWPKTSNLFAIIILKKKLYSKTMGRRKRKPASEKRAKRGKLFKFLKIIAKKQQHKPSSRITQNMRHLISSNCKIHPE